MYSWVMRSKTSISLNASLVGSESVDGNRILAEGEQVVFKINGREYIVEATKDGLTTSKINEVVRDLINNDTGSLDQSPAYRTPILLILIFLGIEHMLGEGNLLI